MTAAGTLATSGASTAGKAINTAKNLVDVSNTAKESGGFFSNPLVQQAGVQALGGMAQGAMQAKAANDQDQRQDQLDAEQRARYSANMGGRLSVFDSLYQPTPNPYPRG